MAKQFKARPENAAKPETVTSFIAGAKQRSTITDLDSSPARLNPKDVPRTGLNLRLNDFEMDLIRKVANAEDRSMQKTIKRFLIPALKNEAERLNIA